MNTCTWMHWLKLFKTTHAAVAQCEHVTLTTSKYQTNTSNLDKNMNFQAQLILIKFILIPN